MSLPSRNLRTKVSPQLWQPLPNVKFHSWRKRACLGVRCPSVINAPPDRFREKRENVMRWLCAV